MRRLRLVDLLLMVANKRLKDGQMVLIDDGVYKFDEREEKFYVPKEGAFRIINTKDMNLTCYILEEYEGWSD